MLGVFSLCWRSCLILALLLNPVLAAGAGRAAPPPDDGAAAASMPPCHEVPLPASDLEDDTTSSALGCDCGNAACEFGACCSMAALEAPGHRIGAVLRGRATFSELRASVSPLPSARLIRPPIA